MKTIRIKSSCKVLGVDKYPGAVVDVPDQVAETLVALGRASIVNPEIAPEAPEHRDEPQEHRDPAPPVARRARAPKPA
jgi:2,4-dienoyl-CoA reductase-like NADH-dependent reductase (Old Yellow Enzyme family)